jgi:hypothetical protein
MSCWESSPRPWTRTPRESAAGTGCASTGCAVIAEIVIAGYAPGSLHVYSDPGAFPVNRCAGRVRRLDASAARPRRAGRPPLRTQRQPRFRASPG